MKYEIFSHKVLIEDEEINTYGIVATKNNNTYTFEDVTTFRDKVEKFVDYLNKENVPLNCFKNLLDEFLNNL